MDGTWHKKYFVPGLVNVNRKLWKDPPFLMAKSIINGNVQ
jgi:hypothetical protein